MHFNKVIGHRGACGYAPENTKASMFKAYELGVKWVEFDVMLTADKVPIVFHDDTLERTTNGKGVVAETSYAELSGLDAGGWFSDRYIGESIPRFYDLLHYLTELDLASNVEIKAVEGQEQITAEAVMDQLHTLSDQHLSQIIVSSFSEKTLSGIRFCDPEVALGFLIDSWDSDWVDVITDLNCISLHVDHTILTPQKLSTIKKMNKQVLAYTVNSIERAQQLFSWGVDAVFSDFPDRLSTRNF